MDADKIGKVAKVAKSDKMKSAQALKTSQQDHQQSCDQLDQLKGFKQEYEDRLETLAGDGMEARQLQDYRRFLGKLNQAIELQASQLASSEEELQLARDDWLAQARRSSALDHLVDREHLKEQRRRDKDEQKRSDEGAMTRSGQIPET